MKPGTEPAPSCEHSPTRPRVISSKTAIPLGAAVTVLVAVVTALVGLARQWTDWRVGDAQWKTEDRAWKRSIESELTQVGTLAADRYSRGELQTWRDSLSDHNRGTLFVPRLPGNRMTSTFRNAEDADADEN